MKKWFYSLKNATRITLCILPLVIGIAFFVMSEYFKNSLLYVGVGILFVMSAAFFLVLYVRTDSYKKQQKDEERFEQEKSEIKEKAVRDADEIPDSDLNAEIQKNKSEFEKYRTLIDKSDTVEQLRRNILSSLYYGNVLLRLTKRKDSLDESFPNQSDAISQADELRKFKELLDDGVITQEEFDYKKNQIIGKK